MGGYHRIVQLPEGPSVNEKQDVNIDKINLFFYSTQDNCRYCRATLSYMLFNGELRKLIQNCFNVIEDRTNLVMDEDIPIKILSFSNEQTDT
jgi:hypothetical protein